MFFKYKIVLIIFITIFSACSVNNLQHKNKLNNLSILIESFRVIGIILKPYIPDASEKILGFLNIKDESRDFKFIDFKYKLKKGHCINDPEPLFPRYE